MPRRTSSRASVPLLIHMAHDAGLQRAVQLFHKPTGSRKVEACPAEVDTTQLRQVVEKLRPELASMVSCDGLWTTEARYPARE
jgi:hypothetical protein